MSTQQRQVPATIDGFRVVEFGAFAEARLPLGYLSPPDGRPAMKPVKNVALCKAEGVDGYYTLFCTEDWGYVTYDYSDTRESAAKLVVREFGTNVIRWQVRA